MVLISTNYQVNHYFKYFVQVFMESWLKIFHRRNILNEPFYCHKNTEGTAKKIIFVSVSGW